MNSNSMSIKKLRTELSQVGEEIDKRIVRLDKLSIAFTQGYEELESAVADKQAVAEAKFRKSLMSSGDEVWHFAWENVWAAVKEFGRATTADINLNYDGLEAALQARQSSLKVQLKVSEMSGDQVWTEVWTAVWQVVGKVNDQYRRTAATALKQVEEELQTLLDKQLVLQTKLDELLASGDKLFKALKGVTDSFIKGKSS